MRPMAPAWLEHSPRVVMRCGDAAVAVGEGADAGEHVHGRGLQHVVVVELQAEQLGGQRPGRPRRRRIGPQRRVVHEEIDRIEAEPIHSALQPERGNRLERIDDRRVVEVERRLPGRGSGAGSTAAAAAPRSRRCRRTRRASCWAACRPPPDRPRRTSRRARRSRPARLSRNQACRSLVWLQTWSISTLRPSAWARASTASKSASVPKIGSTAQWSATS